MKKALLIMILGILGTFTQSSRAFTPVAGTDYRLESKYSGQLLWDTPYNNNLRTQSYTGDGSATWNFVSSNGSYQIVLADGSAAMGCNSGDASVYVQTPSTGTGQLWTLVDAGGGYVAIKNKLNGNAITLSELSERANQPLTTAPYTGLDEQEFWIEQFRITPRNVIAVPAGYNRAAPKKMKLCVNTDKGASVSGTLTVNGTSQPITFVKETTFWGQFYYTNTDTSVANATGSYRVSVPGVPGSTFLVTNNFYRMTPDGNGGTAGISNIMQGFFAYDREDDATSGWVSYIYEHDPNGNRQGNPVYVGPTPTDAHGGWRDATSVDKETLNEGGTVRTLSWAAEDALVGPEGAMLKSEVMWGVNYLLRIQNDEGSFPISLGPDQNPPRIFENVDVGVTARAVAGLAAAARVLAANHAPLSAQCLAAATNGWGWIRNNLNNYITDPTIYPGMWAGSADNVLGAAIELAITTGDPFYFNAATNLFYEGKFASSFDSMGIPSWIKRTGSYVTQTRGVDAAMALARFCQNAQVTGKLKTDIINQLNVCFNTIAARNMTPFGFTSPFEVGFGRCPNLCVRAYTLLNMYRAVGNPDILEGAQDCMNWNYGANPFHASFIVGFGDPNVVAQFNRPRSGSIGEVLPGVVLTADRSSISTWNGSADKGYPYGEGTVFNTTCLPAFITLMDRDVNLP